MSSVNEIYTDSYNNYKEFVSWAFKNRFTCPNGIKINISNGIFNWKKEDFKNGKFLLVLPTRAVQDYFLIKYCPLQFVQDRMKQIYSEDYYNSIKNGTSKFDTFTKEGKYGTHCKVIKKPDIITKYPWGLTNWYITTDCVFITYNATYNKWLWKYELGDGISFACYRCKSLKSIIRHINKWKLPIGTKVKAYSKYAGIDWEFIVTK